MDYVVIVAGGKGLRMGADIPKQFLYIGGKPVLMHTLERFYNYNPKLNLVLVLPKEQQRLWQQLCAKHRFALKHTVVDGGETRFHSSANGLKAIPDNENGVVAIHDGVRPFVDTQVIGRCFEAARTHGACVPVLEVTDTLRYVGNELPRGNVYRDNYRVVQTPQTFDIGLAKKAFTQDYRTVFTDDASVVEAMGVTVAMVEGNRENLKLTTPFDFLVAETLLRERQNNML